MKGKSFIDFINENKKPTLGKLRLVFCGDILQSKSQLKYADDNGYNGLLDNIKFIFEKADLVAANLELSLLGNGEDFTAGEILAKYLSDIGFTHLSVTNNHMLDHGPSGLQTTQSLLSKNGIVPLKIRNLIKLNDYSFEIYNTTTYIEGEYPKGFEEYTKEYNPDNSLDFNLSYIHWGNKGEVMPNNDQLQTAQKLSNKGYEYVIGSGSHIPQRIDVVSNSSVVAYSLGDLVAEHQDDKRLKNEGLILVLEIINNKLSNLIEYKTICKTDNGKSVIDIKSREVII